MQYISATDKLEFQNSSQYYIPSRQVAPQSFLALLGDHPSLLLLSVNITRRNWFLGEIVFALSINRMTSCSLFLIWLGVQFT